MSTAPIDISQITDEDIENLFGEVQQIHEVTNTPEIVPVGIVPTIIDPFAKPKSDFEKYWEEQGSCPICKDGTLPECLCGVFTCPKCGWRLP